MKKLLLKLISAFLAIAAIMSVGFVGCDENDPEKGTQAGEESDTSDRTTGSDLFKYLETDLQKTNYNRTITQLYRGPDQRMSNEIYIKDHDPANKIDDAVYSKNSQVEEYLGIKFEFHPESGDAHGYELIQVLEASVKSGDDEYQIVSNSNGGIVETMLSGSFINMKNVKNIDLSKKYWAQYINDNAEVTGAIFGVTGDISLYLFQELYVCFFNRDLCTQRRINPDSLYQTVLDGEWTLDYMINLTKDIYEDATGDGRTKDDIYGYAMVFAPTDAYWSACDIRVTSRTAGKLTVDVDIQKLGNVVKKLNNFTWSQDGVLRVDNEADKDDVTNQVYLGSGSTLVATDQVLFSNDRLYEVCTEAMKNCNHYGVLPYPKYNRNQKQYYSYVHDSYTVFAIPLPAKNEADVCGAVLECLAWKNHNVVLPVYYEEVLTSRYVHDVNSSGMLDIIFQNIKMDSGVIFGCGLMTLKLLRGLVKDNVNGVSSSYNSEKRTAQAQCDRVAKAYTKYVNNGLK